MAQQDPHAVAAKAPAPRALTLFYRAKASALRVRLKALVTSVLRDTEHLRGANATRKHTWDALADCFPGLEQETLGSASGLTALVD